jgi:hypothetical protein
MATDPPGYGQPYTWIENQEYIERPRMRRETDVEYSVRVSVARLSAQIIASLQSSIHQRDY